MGFPLRSNIFRPNAPDQQYFARFPLQVAILFAPHHKVFRRELARLFAHLDQVTGSALAFFALLDPPEEWLQTSAAAEWWREYQWRAGSSGFTYDDGPLIYELTRLFGVRWADLPVLVISTSLWSGDLVICRTEPWLLEDQLTKLASLSRRSRPLGPQHLFDLLKELPATANAMRRRLGTGQLQRLREAYDVLSTLMPNGRLDRSRFRELTDVALNATRQQLAWLRLEPDPLVPMALLDEARDSSTRDESAAERHMVEAEAAADRNLQDAAGRLVPPATVAERVREALTRDDLPILELLDDESRVMVETALRVGNFLEREGFESIAHNWERSGPPPRVDFAPGAQGIWKAFELEVNLSVVQAARAGRSVRMPDFFARFDPALPVQKAVVYTGGGEARHPKNINQRERSKPRSDRQRFLTLGDSLHVAKALHGNPMEAFDRVVVMALGGPLPAKVLASWVAINELRNAGSHVRPISKEEYEQVLHKGLEPDVIGCLARIKGALSGHALISG
jgi:hypothetical protein